MRYNGAPNNIFWVYTNRYVYICVIEEQNKNQSQRKVHIKSTVFLSQSRSGLKSDKNLGSITSVIFLQIVPYPYLTTQQISIYKSLLNDRDFTLNKTSPFGPFLRMKDIILGLLFLDIVQKYFLWKIKICKRFIILCAFYIYC